MRAPLNWSTRAFAHRAAQVAVDTGLVAAAWWLAFYFRFDGNVPGRYGRLFAGTLLIVIALKVATFVAMRFYTKWWRFTSLRDLQAIVLATAVSSLLVTAVLSQWRPDDLVPVPRGVLVFDLVLTLTFIGGARRGECRGLQPGRGRDPLPSRHPPKRRFGRLRMGHPQYKGDALVGGFFGDLLTSRFAAIFPAGARLRSHR